MLLLCNKNQRFSLFIELRLFDIYLENITLLVHNHEK